MFRNFLGIFLALLPARTRQPLTANWQGNLRRSATASAVLQILICVGLLIFRYQRYAAAQLAQTDIRVFNAAAERGGETAVQSLGLMILIAYVLTPLSLALVYFAAEGAIRLGAALGTAEIIGTLPLVLLEKCVALTGHYGSEIAQGSRIPDFVFEPVTEDNRYHLGIASCRAKPQWDDPFLTISFDDTLYEVAEYTKADPPRRHLYLLRRAPAHKVVRALHHYDPKEGML